MTMAKFVSVNCAGARACARADQGAFPATCETTDTCSCYSGAGDGKLVAMLLPESPVPTMTMLGRCSSRRTESQGYEYQNDCQKLFHLSPSHPKWICSNFIA
jgi:hypothetical protein